MTRISTPPRSQGGLRRSLGLVDLTAIGLNATVGSGIFLLPDDLFRAMGPLSPLAFLVCALGLLPIAWSYAEAARRTQSTGGPYVYAREAFGSQAGFVVGWMCFSNAVFSFSAVASAAAAYAQKLLPFLSGAVQTRAFALAVIALFGALNYLGARPGALAIRLFTFGKFAVLFLLLSRLVPTLNLDGQSAQSGATLTLGGVGGAAFLALFALQGFEVVPVPAGEAKAPESRIPVAVLTTVLTTALFYMLVQAVLVFGFSDLGEVSDAPLADAALAQSPSLGVVVAVGALISTLGFVSGSALGTPRYLFAMASHGELPRGLSLLHPEFRSPHISILVTCALAAALVLPFDYRALIGMSNVAVAVQYGSTSLAVLSLSLRERNWESRRQRVWVPALGTLTSLLICTAASAKELLWASLALAVGVLLRAWSVRKR